MDSDDICTPDRFKNQLEFLTRNPEVDIVGGQIIEYDESMSKEISKRVLPTRESELIEFARLRNPLNHMTVMFKKSSIIKALSSNLPAQEYLLRMPCG